jgi:hypothetical protein
MSAKNAWGLRYGKSAGILSPMKRKYVYPCVVLAAGLLLLVFDRHFSNPPRHDQGEKVEHIPAYKGEPLSISANAGEIGTLEVSFYVGGGEISQDLEGVLLLTALNEDGTLKETEEILVSNPVVTREGLAPGMYRLVARIGIPGTDYDFLAKPQELEIEPKKTTRHRIEVPLPD